MMSPGATGAQRRQCTERIGILAGGRCFDRARGILWRGCPVACADEQPLCLAHVWTGACFRAATPLSISEQRAAPDASRPADVVTLPADTRSVVHEVASR